jgi:hypothetical protein
MMSLAALGHKLWILDLQERLLKANERVRLPLKQPAE